MSKTIARHSEMRAQLAYLPEYYRYFAGMADKIQGDVIPIDKPQQPASPE